MLPPYEIAPDFFVLPSVYSVPGLGTLPTNAFLVRGEEPLLIDTGMYFEREPFVRALESLIDPAELRWIYLTHDDPDHIGGLQTLLERAPQARLITTFIGLGKLGLYFAVQPQRVQFLNPGERLELADRALTVLKPPLYDAPETTAVYDSKLDALFSADTFGGPLEEVPRLAEEIPEKTLAEAQSLWATIDSPWVHFTERSRFERTLEAVASTNPEWILSAHLPPAHRMARRMCENVSRAPTHTPFVGPDQRTFESMLSGP